MTFAEKYPTLVHFATIMGLIGVPTIFSLTVACIVAIKKFFTILNYLQNAIKSQIRNDLINDFDEYQKQGYLSQVELDEWSNRHDAYEKLVGNNEVLKNRCKKILELPIK